MTAPFKRAIIYARHHRTHEGVLEALHNLTALLDQQAVETVLDPDTLLNFSLPYPVLCREAMGKPGDVMIVVGGDGSLLSAARIAVEVNVPVVGIHRGHLGFLTDLPPQDLSEDLPAILNGHYLVEKRFLLQTSVESERGTTFSAKALNDVVINRGAETHLMAFDLFINHRFVSHYRAVGLIIATPTGSTAYALSAGGPIVHPSLDALILVPMFAHRLSSRPLVIPANASITIKPDTSNELPLAVSADSHLQAPLTPHQWLTVKSHPILLTLLHPLHYDYFDTLRIKLGWETNPSGGSL